MQAEDGPQDKPLSDYYVETEGILLGEFGSFLGKLADKIDEQLSRSQQEGQPSNY